MSNNKPIFQFTPENNGYGNVVFAWSKDCSYIAVAGAKKNVYIIDRRGKKLREIVLKNQEPVIDLDWDKDNQLLVILQDKSHFVSIWNVFVETVLVEIAMDNSKIKVSFAKWSKTHPVLAIAGDKGIVLFYDSKSNKRIPTQGKHGKKVISGDWNSQGLLITGGEDKLLCVSNHKSDTAQEQISLKAEPRQIKWIKQKTDQRNSEDQTITAVLWQKAILMYDLTRPSEKPFELQFEQKYGKIVDYHTFGDGYIVVGFSEGTVAHISTHVDELKKKGEVSSERIFTGSLEALCTNNILYKMAVAGENSVRMYSLNTWKEIKNERLNLNQAVGKVTQLSWSNNGQTLVCSTQNGFLYGFITSVPSLTSVSQQYIAILSSFTEVSIIDTQQNNKQIATVTLENEPGLICLGSSYLAAGMNNLIYFYS